MVELAKKCGMFGKWVKSVAYRIRVCECVFETGGRKKKERKRGSPQGAVVHQSGLKEAAPM